MFASRAEMKEIGRLKKRSDFLRVQKSGKKWVSRGLILQAADNSLDKRRFGMTVTKKMSKSAVERNRVKRRLKAVAFDILPGFAREKADYVLIGRRETLTRPYRELQSDLKWCLKRLGYLKGGA